MQKRSEECECSITDEMIWAGPAVQLCHHSTTAAADDVREKLLNLMQEFAQNIKPEDMFDKTITELANRYRQETAGPLSNLMDQNENIVVNINFMRQLSLNIQMLMCTMILQLRGETEDE